MVADRWSPSSKTCSACKAAKAKLPLTERIYRCGHCGLVIDRDLNAAINLASLVGAVGTASGAGTSQEQPRRTRRERRGPWPTGTCSSMNCEDGTGPMRPDKTVTAAEQSTAA